MNQGQHGEGVGNEKDVTPRIPVSPVLPGSFEKHKAPAQAGAVSDEVKEC